MDCARGLMPAEVYASNLREEIPEEVRDSTRLHELWVSSECLW